MFWRVLADRLTRTVSTYMPKSMSIYFVPDVLDKELLEALRTDLKSGVFVDGRSTASGQAAKVKNNEQLELAGNMGLSQAIANALLSNERFREITLARKIRQTQFARYRKGMGYGQHLDKAIFPGESPVRADMSVTIFLSDDYEGGELVIFGPTGEQRVKLPSGHAVIYPSGALHAVDTVTAGERLVAITWVQSHIRDPQLRLICSELLEVGAHLASLPESPEAAQALLLLAKSRNNLMRKFSEF